MAYYKYLGYGVTNDNGRAKLDHNPNGTLINHSYTGKGAGAINIIASPDNTITDESITSSDNILYDYSKYDYGTIEDHNDIWARTAGQLTRDTAYTTVTEGTDGYSIFRTQIPNQDSILEFDIRQDYNSGWSTSFREGSTDLTGMGLGETNTWRHIKILIQGTTINYYKDNSSTPFITRTNIQRDTTKNLYFAFQTPQDLTTVDFKDFKVYPL